VSTPLVTINLKRQFSLPFGVPPDLTATELATYCADLGAAPGWLEYTYKDTDPAFSDADPGLPKDRRVSLIVRSGGATASVVPRTTEIMLPSGALALAVLTAAQVASIGKPGWTPAVPAGAEPLPVTHASRFRWDDVARSAAVLPQPFPIDDTLAVVIDPAAPSASIGADLAGVLDDDAATHLLSTIAAARGGELDPLLMRAPALGLARFERYRHVEATLSGATVSGLSVAAQSAAGAMITRVLPDALTPSADARAPILKEHTFVYEHLDVNAVAECIASIVWLQFLRFSELVALRKFNDVVRRQCTWALRCWHASETLGLGAAGSLGLPSATIAPLAGSSTPSVAQLGTIITDVLSNTAAKSGLRDFVVQTYSHLLAGKSWVELGIDFPVAPGTRVAALAWAHEALEGVTMTPDTWLVVYAGCPLGRPARVYPFAPLLVNNAEVLRKGVSTFDLEALVLAGHAADVFAAVAPPAPPIERTGVIDLAPYAANAQGRLAAVRLVEKQTKRPFTTRDCLRERITGWNRLIEITSTFDFSPLATASHPLEDALSWGNFTAAGTARASMDTLHTATSAGKTLSQQIVDFWVSAAAFGSGAAWPVQEPGVPAATKPAGPSSPYAPGDTGKGGFDVFDLDAALAAAICLRDGYDRTKSPDLPVILALLDREGYRRDGLWQRAGELGDVFRDNMNAFSVGDVLPGSALDGFARAEWILRVFGMDVLNRDVDVGTEVNWRRFARRSFAGHIQTLLDTGVAVHLDPARMKEYTLARVAGKASGTGVIQAGLLSRQLQWIGIVAQHGEFQRRHKLLRQGPAAGPLDRFWFPHPPGRDGPLDPGGTTLAAVPEYTAPAPDPGNSAEHPSRYDYLAYYSFLYLAFNGSPSVVNSWINVVNAKRGAIPAPAYFLYKISDADAAGGGRILWHRGHVLRFIVALDAYLRISATDTAPVVRPNPPWDM
jgi:hypothetical protein